ncbi:MAG: hypothetical protein GXN99_00335 [Candidatus Nanohaloarchaeota archaeon]|nr:hypothetical protein [Candidatus Nanohaloarchaeota archaeon]
MKFFNGLLVLGFVLIVLSSGCVNGSSKNSAVTTEEFDLKISSFETYPPYVQEGQSYVLKFFVKNDGNKVIKFKDLDISIEAPCQVDTSSLSIYPENIYSGKEDAYYLSPGSMAVIKVEGTISKASIPKGSCKGRLLYTYEDVLEAIKYVAVVNERELTSSSEAIKVKPAEVKSNMKQLEVKINVEEPVIVSNDKNEFPVNIVLKNKGNGNIKIKQQDIKFSLDENLVFTTGKKCHFSTDDEVITLKPDQSLQISCALRLVKIPAIREDYRIGLKVPYEVRFAKDFEVIFEKKADKGIDYYELTNVITGKMFSINLDVGKYLRDGLDPGDVGKEMLKDVGKVFLRNWLVENTGIIVKDFSEGVDAYTREYYAPRYGTRDGMIFAKLRAESLAKRIFEGKCSHDPDLQEIEYDCCEGLASLKSQGKCGEVMKYIEEEGCVERIIYVEEDKINALIDKGVEQNAELIKKELEEAVRKSVEQDQSKLKEIYMPWVKQHLSRSEIKSNIVGDGKIVINTRFDGLVEVITENLITEVLLDYIRKHKIPIAISSFREGYSKAFWESYTKHFGIEFPNKAYEACIGTSTDINKYV